MYPFKAPCIWTGDLTNMEKIYDPTSIETACYQHWERAGYFAPSGTGTPYCIMLPPPNVTGGLHMGHAFQHTLMDILIRYHRMIGDRTLWQCGTDHAGIATQMVVERQLEQQGTDRHTLGREKFVDAVWRWKRQSGDTISRQLRRLGTSMDWSRERFTMDKRLSGAVHAVFIRLYKEGLIYRGQRLVNWDPVLHTAISDLEVIATEENGFMWHIKYPRADGNGHITVATTRPETMLGDVAVAVHPDDSRYADLIGKRVALPLTGRTLPVVADPHVDHEFGTGCVKITPAHDFNDYDLGKRHGLPLVNIFTVNAALNDKAPSAYRGMDRYAARKRIVADLEALGLIEKIEPHRLMTPRGDRSHAVIEPYLTDQWFVRIAPLAAPAVEAVAGGDIQFVPPHWAKTYFAWMEGVQDWCISRQLWWGHRIPAWYDDQGAIYVGESEAEVRREHSLADEIVLRQDADVLDTWFSSALWPLSTLGWPNTEAEAFKQFYPTSVLVTGFDIIFFWVARMIMMGLKFTDQVPFKAVYIHGLVRDANGRKMSKSKGNVIDPIDLIDGIELAALIEKRTAGLMNPQDAKLIERTTRKQFPNGIDAYGTDALRFTFASLATQGRDINFDTTRIGGYRNFCNKLWNAARFVTSHVERTGGVTMDAPAAGVAERWILSKLDETIEAATDGINNYRFDLAAKAVYEFTWNAYCDWYLEFSKVTLADDAATANDIAETRWVLAYVLEVLMRLAHPIMPFITEEIWQKIAPLIGRSGNTIMQAGYPTADSAIRDEASCQTIDWIKAFILGVRRIRAERDIDPRKPLTVNTRGGSETEQHWLVQNRRYLQKIGRVDTITPMDKTKTGDADLVPALAGEMTLLVPLADLIDPEAERQRLEKVLEKLKKSGDSLRKKLDNKQFIERAPAQIVNERRRLLEENRIAVDKLESEYRRIAKVARR